MVDINGMFNSLFSLIGSITGAIRDMVVKTMPNYSTLILLGLGILGGWYLAKKFPKLDGYYTIALYGIIIFLLLRFV